MSAREAILSTLDEGVMRELHAAAERAQAHGPEAAGAMRLAIELAEQARGGDVAAFGRLLDVLASVAWATLEGEELSAMLEKLGLLRVDLSYDLRPDEVEALGVDVVRVDFTAGTTPEQDAALRAWASARGEWR